MPKEINQNQSLLEILANSKLDHRIKKIDFELWLRRSDYLSVLLLSELLFINYLLID